MGTEHLAVDHCIHIHLPTKNEIAEEEMLAQGAVENNLIVILPIIISEWGPYNLGSSRIESNRCTLEKKH